MNRFKIKNIASFIENKPWVVFIFFASLIFICFQSLFQSYFEADEWVHFTYYLPLTEKSDGFFTAFISTFINTGFLTGQGLHINPIGTLIFFLNTKFFGLHFAPYAFMSLLLHAINSFLIFLLIKTLLNRKEMIQKNVYALLGGIFFALAPTPLHTITGAAAFYSYNVLSVTFFLLCVISFKMAFIKKQKKFIYVTIFFLFLALFSKETTAFLFILLPFMTLIEKRIFSLKFLGKLFLLCVIVYTLLRFFLPNIQVFYMPPSYQPSQQVKVTDDKTIASSDLSIHKNLSTEILLRTVTFPVRMMGTVFISRHAVFDIVKFITPVIVPIVPGGDATAQLIFLYGSGNYVVIYLLSIGLFIFCVVNVKNFIQNKQKEEARVLALGVAIIIFSALPLVAIIFSFPRWGYDFYFDSRHYYNPTVGAAIVFPFLLFGVARLLSNTVRIMAPTFIAFGLFIVWLIYNFQMLSLSINQFIPRYSSDRREVVEQIKQQLPQLPQKAVFYTETDGLGAYGSALPFDTSIPQAFTVVYYDKNPLPDSFFTKPLFDGKPEGYLYSEGRGFGYYTSKQKLSKALLSGKFKTSDIYAFSYDSKNVKIKNITAVIRKEMESK